MKYKKIELIPDQGSSISSHQYVKLGPFTVNHGALSRNGKSQEITNITSYYEDILLEGHVCPSLKEILELLTDNQLHNLFSELTSKWYNNGFEDGTENIQNTLKDLLDIH